MRFEGADAPPLGRVATFDPTGYVAYNQTSGTTGRPLTVLDTAESWAWWADCWQYVYHAAGVTPRDRIFFAFSFGPFIGFWHPWSYEDTGGDVPREDYPDTWEGVPLQPGEPLP